MSRKNPTGQTPSDKRRWMNLTGQNSTEGHGNGSRVSDVILRLQGIGSKADESAKTRTTKGDSSKSLCVPNGPVTV